MLGYTEDEFASLPREKQVLPEHRNRVGDRLKQMVAGKVPSVAGRRRLQHRDGRTIETESQMASLQFEGEPAGMAIAIRDVTAELAAVQGQRVSDEQFRDRAGRGCRQRDRVQMRAELVGDLTGAVHDRGRLAVDWLFLLRHVSANDRHASAAAAHAGAQSRFRLPVAGVRGSRTHPGLRRSPTTVLKTADTTGHHPLPRQPPRFETPRLAPRGLVRPSCLTANLTATRTYRVRLTASASPRSHAGLTSGRFYGKRQSVERCFSRLKQHRALDTHCKRGPRKVTLHALMGIVTMQAAALVRAERGEIERVREVSRKVA